ncbi:uncharacterized protein LOC129730163 [Wyeomyia smithii]|uniref:uncharacterized protein LOC129730163 n=1 Tax=Wyeomyia smithii TaxID=174621 RepID=UPI002467E2D6|nr:uncharacterized protein LOC129730163 [Wyeomyia smithii]
MIKQWRIMSGLVLMAMLVLLRRTHGEDNAFIDDPPDGYYQRTTLDDCPSRFYSEDVSSALGFYILGGLRAFRSEFPHMAAIGWTNKDTGKVDYICGGSLISTRFVVTAGHCGTNEEKIAPDTVRLGDTNLASQEDDRYAQDIKIKKFTPHPSYQRTQKYSDIALIELEQDAKLDVSVCPICLWSKDNLQTFTGGFQAVGFGLTDFASDPSPTLQKVTLNYWDYNECNSNLPRPRSLFKGLTSDQFCSKTPSKDTCQGDSGGPIQIDLSDVSKVIPYLVGVTSFGTGCWDGSFGVYTKISSYINWIASIVNVTIDPLECARQTECLSSRKFSDSRITAQNNSPFFRVELQRSGESFNHCSGALIDYRHVVTSASCTRWNGKDPSHIKANEQMIKITDINRHPMYVSGQHYNDIAVLTLDKFYNPHKIYQIVAPACIWKNERIPEPVVFFSAYGPDFTGSTMDATPSVPLKIITAFRLENGRCNTNDSSRFKDELPGGFNSDFICSENPVDLVPGICRLKPGGPISNFRRDNIVPYVYGINTLGEQCGGAENIFVAIRISFFYNWIESVVLNRTEIAQKSSAGIEGEMEIDKTVVEASLASRSDFPFEEDLVSYVFPGLITADHRLRPYGNRLVPGGLRRVATAAVHHRFGESSENPLEVTIYGTQLQHVPLNTEDLLQTLDSIAIQHQQCNILSQPPPLMSNSSYEIVKSIELTTSQPDREQIFQQQQPGQPSVPVSQRGSTVLRPFLSPSTAPQFISPVAPTLVQRWSTQSISPPCITTPSVSNTRQYQQPPVPVNRYLPRVPAQSVSFPPSFSITRSVELYQDGRCTLSSGLAGRCLHYSLCRRSPVATLIGGGGTGGGIIGPSHGWSYCNYDLLIVCCPI